MCIKKRSNDTAENFEIQFDIKLQRKAWYITKIKNLNLKNYTTIRCSSTWINRTNVRSSEPVPRDTNPTTISLQWWISTNVPRYAWKSNYSQPTYQKIIGRKRNRRPHQKVVAEPQISIQKIQQYAESFEDLHAFLNSKSMDNFVLTTTASTFRKYFPEISAAKSAFHYTIHPNVKAQSLHETLHLSSTPVKFHYILNPNIN